jgi:hypothetical protein
MAPTFCNNLWTLLCFSWLCFIVALQGARRFFVVVAPACVRYAKDV